MEKNELQEIPPPMGDFILQQSDVTQVMTPNGAYYHFTDIIKILKRLENKIKDDLKEPETLLTFYAVRSKDGKYFRAKGYMGSGENWVDEIERARIYNKPGPAKSRITYFLKHWPEYGSAEVVELHVKKLTAFTPPITSEMRKIISKKIQSKILNKPNDFFEKD